MDIKRVCLFVPDKEKDSEDGKLRYRIKWNGNTVAFNVGYRVDLDNWNKDTQRCRINTSNGRNKISAAIINRAIQKMELTSDNVFHNFEKQGKIPTADQFRTAFNTEIGHNKILQKKSLAEVLDRFIIEESRNKQWQPRTRQKYETLYNRLNEYCNNATFLQFDKNGLVDYMYYLINDKDYVNTTIEKEFQLLRHFFSWASSNDYCVPVDYLTFKPKLKIPSKTVIFLSWEELMSVYNYKFTPEQLHLERVCDVFLFCCFTGIRYSDVSNLKRGDLKDGHIEITTVKTADRLIIELNKYSKAILDKYKDVVFDDNKALPVISNQKMNDALKIIGMLCNVTTPVTVTSYSGSERIETTQPKCELLSTHAGRRTFICNAIALGISPQVIMKWTGHSDYKSMKPYIDVADSIKSEAMNLFNKN